MDGMMLKSLMEVGITDSGPNNRQTACYYDRFFFFWLVDSPVDCRFTREVGFNLVPSRRCVSHVMSAYFPNRYPLDKPNPG